jgi:hypothetical protein
VIQGGGYTTKTKKAYEKKACEQVPKRDGWMLGFNRHDEIVDNFFSVKLERLQKVGVFLEQSCSPKLGLGRSVV